MSGGAFDYRQGVINQLIDDLERLLCEQRKVELRQFPRVSNYAQSVAEYTIRQLKICYTCVQRLDWLISGDDGDESFATRLHDELPSEALKDLQELHAKLEQERDYVG